MAAPFILGAHKYLLAPMVEQSELAFRMLVRKYNCSLCYTPMINARSVCTKEEHLNDCFSTIKDDRPLVVQVRNIHLKLAGSEPEYMLKAAKMVENLCDAIDLNLGCPQSIARRGRYGAYLLEEWDTIKSVVELLSKEVKVPITCKIRILSSSIERTLELSKNLEKWGCSMLTVHGRTKEMNKQLVEECNWDVIKQIKQIVIANGGIECYEDIERCLLYTKCDGVMVGEAILENPAIFDRACKKSMDELALEYIEYAVKYSATSTEMRGHLFKMLQSGLTKNTDLRDQLGAFKFTGDDWLERINNLIKELGSRMNKYVKWGCYNITLDPLSYYQRHRTSKRKREEKELEKSKITKE